MSNKGKVVANLFFLLGVSQEYTISMERIEEMRASGEFPKPDYTPKDSAGEVPLWKKTTLDTFFNKKQDRK